MEVTYTRGKPGELDEIRDFANMVFSMHTRPHDFARMLPKLYADGSATEGEHYLVREDGRLVAAVCAHPFTLACGDRTLPCAAIGSVSVHPYVRGKGYMRKLMTTAVADMAQNGIALSVLDGRRHRYAYFGYEPAGLRAEYTITPDNLRHMSSAHKLALAAAPAIPSDTAETKALLALQSCRTVHSVYTAQSFHTAAVSWDGRLLVLRGGSEIAGFCITSDAGRIGELALQDEALLYDALRAVQEYLGCETLTLPCAGWDTARMQQASPLYDRLTLYADDKYRIFDYPAAAAFFLQAKAAQRPLPDGRLTLCVEGGQPFALTLENGRADAVPCDTADYQLTHAEAMALLFSPEGLLLPQPAAPAGWLPLPVYVDSPDKC